MLLSEALQLSSGGLQLIGICVQGLDNDRPYGPYWWEDAVELFGDSPWADCEVLAIESRHNHDIKDSAIFFHIESDWAPEPWDTPDAEPGWN